MSGLQFIENLINDVRTLKVLLFALYGWAFAATVFIAILYVRRRRAEPVITIADFAHQYGLLSAKKERAVSEGESPKKNAPWRGKPL